MNSSVRGLLVMLVLLVPCSVDAGVIDVVGGMANVGDDTFRARGNVFRVDTGTVLLEHEFLLTFIGTKPIDYYVFQSPVEFGTYEQIHRTTVSQNGVGTAWYSSGPMDVELVADNYYIIAISASGDEFAYFYETDISEPVSFGAQVHGFTLAVHPLDVTTTSTSDEQVIYHQRLTTIPEPATLALLAFGALVMARRRGRVR